MEQTMQSSFLMSKKGKFQSLVTADWQITDVHIATSPWEYHDLKTSLNTKTSKNHNQRGRFSKNTKKHFHKTINKYFKYWALFKSSLTTSTKQL